MKKFVAVVFTYNNDALILQRRDNNAPNNPNTVGFFGGRVEKGETPLQSIKREISEETNLEVSSLRFKYLFDVNIPINAIDSEQGVDYIFHCQLKSTNFEVYEGAGKEAYRPKELLGLKDLSPYSRVIAERWLEEMRS